MEAASIQSEDSPRATAPSGLPWLLVIVFGAIWGLVRVRHAEVLDDAFITFRYARNLLEGNGFVFNPGERVLGTTVPLFGLFVAAGMKLGFAPWAWVFAWDVLWGFVILRRIQEVMAATGAGRWFGIAATIVVIVWWPITMSPPGMETFLYLVLIFSALSAVVRGRRALECVAWATGAALLRPDGVTTLAAVVICVGVPMLRERRWREIAAAWWPVLALPVLAIALTSYFGSFVPQTVAAKRLEAAQDTQGGLFTVAFLRSFVVLGGAFNPLGIASAVGLIGAMARRDHLPVTAFFILYTGAFMIGHAPDFGWYLSPIFLLMAVGAARAIGSAAEWVVRRVRHSAADARAGDAARATALAAVLVVLLSMPLAALNARLVRELLIETGFSTSEKAYHQTGEWLRANTPPDATVAAGDVGALGYFSERRIFDLEGLVTPEAVRLKAAGRLSLSGTDARWLVQSFWEHQFPPEDSTRWKESLSLGFRPVVSFEFRHGRTWIFTRGE